jgi:oligopeptidase A
LIDRPSQKETAASSAPVPPRSLSFEDFDAEATAEDLERRIKRAKALVEAALGADHGELIATLELISEDLNRRFAPLRHLNSVASTPATRKAYESTLATFTDFDTWLGQHEGLYEAFRKLSTSADFADRTQTEQALINHALLDFRLSGADLPSDERENVRTLIARLAELGNRFEMQLLDATEAWQLELKHKAELSGLPEAVIALLAERAKEKKLEGWLVTLDPGVVNAILTHAEDRALRHKVHTAFASRASDAGPQAGRFDNGPLVEDILATRCRLAQTLGYRDYADYALVDRMASSADEVAAFLEELARRARPRAEKEFVELETFAREQGLNGPLEPWDIGYYSEKLRRARYDIDEERLRHYLPLEHVLEGLRGLFRDLYGLRFQTIKEAATWQSEVRVWELSGEDKQPIGRLYLDLYARGGKRGGAWMDEGGHRLRLGDTTRESVAFLTANFLSPAPGAPSLISHDDAVTLCHELGHCLHHLLTQIDYPSVGGISGVAWDAVEFPSQLHEEFAWHPAGLALLAADSATGEPMPRELMARLGESRRFHGAMRLVRQLEFALFDLKLHTLDNDTPTIADVRHVLRDAREATRVTPIAQYDRFECGFAHIFGGGYAAGYYSYLWAEVMARDGFAAFTVGDDLNIAAGHALASTVLASGGSRPARELYRAFRGHDPDPAPLLASYGIG